MRQLSLIPIALGLLLTAPHRADAAESGALPHLWEFAAGQPAHPVHLRVDEAAGGTRVTVRGPAGGGSAVVGVEGVSESRLEHLVFRGGAQATIVYLRGRGGEGAALLTVRGGRARVLWTGRTDLHGDPGERVADALEVLELGRDGERVPVVGRIAERATVCGGGRILSPRALDPRTLTLRPVQVPRVPAASATAAAVLGRAESPGPAGRPLLRGLRFVGASSRADGDEAAVAVPTELTDGDPGSAWVEGAPGGGVGEFVTARWEAAPRPLRALALWAPHPSVAAPPRTLWIASDDEVVVRVSLPDAWPSEGPLWVPLPEGIAGRCLALVIGEVRSDAAGARTGLAEVAAYSDLDFAEGLAALVDELSLEPGRSREAARWLGTVGPAAVPPILAAWPEMPTRERRLALPVLARHGASSADARAVLAEAARGSGDEAMRRTALEGLGAAGPEGREALAGLVADPGLGDAAALVLVQADPALALGAALAALGAAEGPRHGALRRVIGDAAARLGAEADPLLRRFAAGAPSPSIRAEVALALAAAPSAPRPLAELLIDDALLASEGFEPRWYTVAAWRELPGSERGAAWLEARAREPSPWMLRAAALEALAHVAPARGLDAARTALTADEPRVRVVAIRVLGSGPTTAEAIAELALRDPWPRVRVAAVEAIAPIAEAAPVLRAAVRDRKSRVRVAAIRALTRARDPEAWTVIEERLRSDGEAPAVTRASIAYARSQCLVAALPALSAVVERALGPSPWAPDVDAALDAIEAAASIGGPDAEAILRRAEAPSALPALRDAALRARRMGRPCGP